MPAPGNFTSKGLRIVEKLSGGSVNTIRTRIHLPLAVVLFVAVTMATSLAMAKTTLRVAYSSISGSAVVPWIAFDKGLYAKYDLDLGLIYVAGSQATHARLGGTTQIGLQGIEL